jgi:peroxiredoxin
VLLDPEQEASKEFEVKTTPATFVITPEGEIIYEHFNYKAGQEKELQEIIDDYLAELDEDK